MAVTRLQEDLLQEFREEKRMIEAQIELFEPLAATLRKPAASRLTNKGLILIAELLCWALVAGAVLLCIFLNRIYPFYVLTVLMRPDHVRELGQQDVQAIRWAVYVLIIGGGLLALLLARTLARVRQKNDMLSMAGARIRSQLDTFRKRKAALEAIDARHFNEPQALRGAGTSRVNDVPNPGFDPQEPRPKNH